MSTLKETILKRNSSPAWLGVCFRPLHTGNYYKENKSVVSRHGSYELDTGCMRNLI